MRKSFPTLANKSAISKVRSSINTGTIMTLPIRVHQRWPAAKQAKPDFTNQLDLFSGAPIDPRAEAVPSVLIGTSPAEVINAREPLREHDPAALANPPSEHGDGNGAHGPAHAGRERGGSTGGGSSVRIPLGAQDAVPRGLGVSDAGVPAARRDSIVIDAEPEQKRSRDFRITSDHRIGQGSLHHKARDNIAAIRTLKTLEAENRDATNDEKTALARYAGWGALSSAFDWDQPPELKQTAKDLREILSDDEYESARASTPNAHFTSPTVIAGIWEGMQRLGLREGAQILEPSLGVGHFLGLMPDDLLQGSHRTGVELDSVTARIAQKLYPDSTIFSKAFEETPLPDNYFDAVVGNVPFGDYRVHDPSYHRTVTRAIHDYFFAKSLDKVRPGGVMALITSRYTMDKHDETVRAYLAERADLLGAIRLPNTAFKANAGTEVTTDILFLRKRRAAEQSAGHAWRQLEPIGTEDGNIDVNQYFARHPQMMLGKMKLEGTMYRGAEPTLEGELTPQLLTAALQHLPEGAYIPRDKGRSPPLQQIVNAEAFAGVKEGAFTEQEGRLFIRNGASLDPANISAASAERVRGMMLIRDAVRHVFKTQLDDAQQQDIDGARSLLNRAYDSYVRRHGPLSSKDNIRAFAGDPDHPLLLSLENYDAETKRASKAAIFERRTLERYKPAEHVETAAEALAISLNETGKIHWPRLASLTGRTEKQLQRELDELIYRNPDGGNWETADAYLSGNVRARLIAAEAAAALDPSYVRNVEALKAVQPPDLQPGDISARLGSSWIPASDVRDFIAELFNTPANNVTVSHAGAIAAWTVTLDGFVRASVSNISTHGTPRVRAGELIEDALNGRTPTVYDQLDKDTRVINQPETLAAREKQQQLKDRFGEWVWQDEQRAHRLARHYNDIFNNLRLRTFDGSHLTFPGMNKQILRDGDLDKHQKDAVWRMLQSDGTLLAHCVGAGKTWEITAGAMEMRRLGLATKPMIVVPNHLVEQWGAAFLQLYPQANIFVAGREHFSKGYREQAMSRIATGNYDAVIVSHRSFELLPVSDELFARFVDKQILLLEDAIYEAKAEKGDSRRIVKELEKAKKRLTAKIKDRAGRENKDRTLTFEELGVDQIFVDESDLYKNLGFVSKMNRIAGLPNTESNRAQDMFVKTGYLRDRNEGRGVVFATGTPISNTMAEMYTLQRYLAPEMLASAGVEHFDAWAANFGEAVTSLELSPDGSGYRMHTRFAKFVNLPELLSMFRSFADVQTADMLKLPRPELAGGKPHVVAAPASPELKAYVQTLVDRAQRLRNGGVDPRTDNMLKITGDGRKAALDMRLVSPGVHVDTETKISRAISKIHQKWEATRDKRSTQLVFCDVSTPNPDKFNVYDEVRDRLTRSGIPAADIAYIHDADTDAQKKALFDSVNAGRIRILLGSTEKMGAGTNVQRKLVAEHHLDAPWRPRDIEQREGRILRQGNENPEVDIYRYVTEGSFDAYMWQTLETKARFIQQVMNGSVTVRHAEDLDSGALTYAEIKAIASGNPAVMEKVKVDTEIRKLDQLRSSHINQQHNIRWQVRNIPDHIRRAKETAESIHADIATRDGHSEGEFTMLVGRRSFAGKGARDEAAKALNDVALSWRNDETPQMRARFKGFEIVSRGHSLGSDREPDLLVRGALTYRAQLNPENPLGTIQSIEHAIRALDRRAQDEREDIERQEKALAEYQSQLGRPFEHERRLKELLAKQAELNAALDLDKNERQIAQNSSDAEPKDAPTTFVARLQAEDRAAERAF
jgi:N12 class adenine-specific DNA methylase